jgi:hypothetical protein
MSLHPDAVEIHDVWLTSYAHYHGYKVMKCCDRNGGIFTFLIPSHDLEILKAEIEDDQTSIYVKSFIDSVKRVRHMLSLARQNLGEWISEEWKAVIYKRAA